MVLLQIHPERVTFPHFEGDAPWAVHVDRVTRRPMAPQPMEIESRNMEIRCHGRRVQRIEHQERSCLQVRTNPTAPAILEELLQALVPPRPYHGMSVNRWLSFVNY
jgi:hypothetical protein